jgi:translation initiation factor 3 subunit A
MKFTNQLFFQEAFRSVEDIHGLMSLVKRTPKPSVLVIYYAKLTEIFWISESHLYHAYAWLKLFNLQKSYNKNITQKDLQLLASSVLLAALSVTPYDNKYGASHLELENEKERGLRMANLVNFSLDSKRENREMVSYKLFSMCIFLQNIIIRFLINKYPVPFSGFKSISSL